MKTFQALWGLRGKGKTEPFPPQPSKGIFFTMETNYLEKIEEALINAAIEKEIELVRNFYEGTEEHAKYLESLLRNKKREYWIKRGIELFGKNLPF